MGDRRMVKLNAKLPNLTAEDLGEDYRIEVCRTWVELEMRPFWIGPEMRPSFRAQFLHRVNKRGWRPIGKPILNDASAVGAVRDLLSALEAGLLPR